MVALFAAWSWLPALTALLIASWGWRWTWALFGAVIPLLICPLAWLYVRDSPEELGLTLDGDAVTEFTERTGELDPAVGSINSISSFGEDGLGEMYIVERSGTVIHVAAGTGLQDGDLVELLGDIIELGDAEEDEKRKHAEDDLPVQRGRTRARRRHAPSVA